MSIPVTSPFEAFRVVCKNNKCWYIIFDMQCQLFVLKQFGDNTATYFSKKSLFLILKGLEKRGYKEIPTW